MTKSPATYREHSESKLEPPNQSLTLLEKLIGNSGVSFTVVHLSPDDKGGEKSKPFAEQKLRARHNVTFELGNFLGKLERKQLLPLLKDEQDLEILSARAPKV